MKLKTNTEKNTSALMAQALIGRSFQDGLQGRSREREGEAVVLQGHSGASFLGAIYMYFFVLGDISFGCRGHDVNLIDPRK